jgi:hypothetical protein
MTSTTNGAAHPARRDIEGELTDLEGLAIALKIVRHGDGTFTDLRHDSPDYLHALYATIDTVLEKIGELSLAYRGEPLGILYEPDAGEDELPDGVDEGDGGGEGEEAAGADPRPPHARTDAEIMGAVALALKNPTIPAAVIELLDRMTAERLDRVDADLRAHFGERCHAWAAMAETPWGRDDFGRPLLGPLPSERNGSGRAP